jgi:nucleoside-diphosphate-sugar epimerase
MRVLVTGSEGYLGSVVTPRLIALGHHVSGADTGYYRDGHLYHEAGDLPHVINRDIRQLSVSDLESYDAVVHMADLSNDPAGDLSPEATHAINHHGTVRLAEIAREAGVRRFIYMSSCSVYGVANGEDPVTEETPPNPQTAYALCKTLCERDISHLARPGFSPVFFRNATAFGASPRQRFDLVLNNLCGLAWTTRRIVLTSDGMPWRPLIHAQDIAAAICCALEAPADSLHGEIINIGSDHGNYRVYELAEIVARYLPGCTVGFGHNGSDNRSYRVSFEKLTRLLPSFRCHWNVEQGVNQLFELFHRIELVSSDFAHRAYTRTAQLQHLLRTRQIDPAFFWKPLPCESSKSLS